MRVVASSGVRRTTQSTLVALGDVLLGRWASAAAAQSWTTPATTADEPEPDPTERRVGTCRRMSRNRIDCMREATGADGRPPFRCAEIVAVRLMAGAIATNAYRCPAFERKPASASKWWSDVDLSTLGRG